MQDIFKVGYDFERGSFFIKGSFQMVQFVSYQRLMFQLVSYCFEWSLGDIQYVGFLLVLGSFLGRWKQVDFGFNLDLR